MFIIRPERASEFSIIHDLVQKAFTTAEFADGDEQEYVERLRKSERYVPDLALVAEKNGCIVGHIMLTLLPIETETGVRNELLLAPLCVAEEYRNLGCGGLLIEEAIRRAKVKKFGAVFLAGNPLYYRRHHFSSIISHDISAFSPIPAQYLLVREIIPGELKALESTTVSIAT